MLSLLLSLIYYNVDPPFSVCLIYTLSYFLFLVVTSEAEQFYETFTAAASTVQTIPTNTSVVQTQPRRKVMDPSTMPGSKVDLSFSVSNTCSQRYLAAVFNVINLQAYTCMTPSKGSLMFTKTFCV